MAVIDLATARKKRYQASVEIDGVEYGSPEDIFRDPAVSFERKVEGLVLHFLPLVKYVANRLALRIPSHVSLDDLISSGTVGLIDAIKKFDPKKEVEFKTYAEFRIKGAILDELRGMDWIPRSVRKKQHRLWAVSERLRKELNRPPESQEIAEALEMEMDEFYDFLKDAASEPLVALDDLPGLAKDRENGEARIYGIGGDLRSENIYQAVNHSQLRDIFARSIRKLPFEQKLIVCLYYYEEITSREIGLLLGYTESRISQLLKETLLKLGPLLAEELGMEIENFLPSSIPGRHARSMNKSDGKIPKTLKYSPVNLAGTHVLSNPWGGKTTRLYIPDFVLVGDPFDSEYREPSREAVPPSPGAETANLSPKQPASDDSSFESILGKIGRGMDELTKGRLLERISMNGAFQGPDGKRYRISIGEKTALEK